MLRCLIAKKELQRFSACRQKIADILPLAGLSSQVTLSIHLGMSYFTLKPKSMLLNTKEIELLQRL